MASWTDNPNISFNPYVQQVPVEAFVNVGVQKQNQYNEGIQRIQNQIDTVAGLEVYRDIDKQYLQSKLNEVGGDLKKVAAGDFSQYQLVNSVGGMINKIGRDKNILGAVSSTQKVKKGFADLESSRKSGKSSPENEWWWNNQVQAWNSDPNVGASFSGSFIEYHDVDKKLRDLTEKLKEVDNSIDIPYRRDGQGNILTDQNGNPLVDDAMLRIKTKGKSEERILSNFYASLDEKDKQQLLITSNYHYRNLTKEGLKNELINNYSQEKDLLSKTLVDLNIELKTNSKLTTTQKGAIEAKINDINDRLQNNQLDNVLQKDVNNIESLNDLSDYKYKIYTQKYLTTLAKSLSHQSYEQEITNNPYSQMAMEKARLQFQYDNANRQQANWEADFGLKQAELFAKQQKNIGASKPAVPGRIPTDVDIPTLNKLKTEITSLIGDEKTGDVGQLDVLNSKYIPLLTDSTLSTPEQKKNFLDRLSIEYAKDPGSIEATKDPIVREYLETRRSIEIQAAQKQNLYNAAVEASNHFEQDIEKVYEGLEGTSGYTPKELHEVRNSLINEFTETFTASGPGAKPIVRTNFNNFLQKYEGTKYEDLARALVKKEQNLPLSKEEKNLTSKSEKIGDTVRGKVRDISESRNKFQSDYLAARMPERQTMIFTLDVNNSKIDDRIDESAVEYLIGNKLKEYQDLGSVDNDNFKDFDPEVISEMKADKEASYTIEKKFDGSADLTILSKGSKQVIPMTAEEFSSYFPGYSRKNPIDNIKYAILGSPNKTTNISGRKNDPVNAYITGFQLPQLSNTNLAGIVRADVEGHPDNKGDNNDRYVIRMYVNDNNIWKSDIITQAGYVNDAKLNTILQQIGTKTVHDLLNKNRK